MRMIQRDDDVEFAARAELALHPIQAKAKSLFQNVTNEFNRSI